MTEEEISNVDAVGTLGDNIEQGLRELFASPRGVWYREHGVWDACLYFETCTETHEPGVCVYKVAPNTCEAHIAMLGDRAANCLAGGHPDADAPYRPSHMKMNKKEGFSDYDVVRYFNDKSYAILEHHVRRYNNGMLGVAAVLGGQTFVHKALEDLLQGGNIGEHLYIRSAAFYPKTYMQRAIDFSAEDWDFDRHSTACYTWDAAFYNWCFRQKLDKKLDKSVSGKVDQPGQEPMEENTTGGN